MPAPLTRDEIERRRRAQRRRIRRRRLTGLTMIAGGAALALALGIWAASGDQSPSTASAQATAAVRPTGQRAVARRQQARTSLGSGKPVTLAFGGDVHFESPIREQLAASPSSVLPPNAPVLSRADIAMVNLETAVTDRGTPAPKTYVFRAPASALSALSASGVDIVTMANNHGMDFGTTGLGDTLRAGRRAGMPIAGAGWNAAQAYAPRRFTVKGQRIAVIGATQVLDDHLISAWTAGPQKMGLASAKEEDRLVAEVRKARRSSDTVVVYVHWGLELSSCPTGSQTSLARRLVGAGADVVVGSHAHVLLGSGRLGRALVSYGLGNFVFYAFRDVTTQSGVLEVTVTGRRIDGYRWVPARISNGIPYPLTGAAAGQSRASWRSLRSCTDLRR